MSRLAALLLLASVLLAPLSAAQAPLPDPSPAVAAACGVVRAASPSVADDVPVCPRAEPGPPDAGTAPSTPAPADPQDAAALAQDASDQAQQAAQDPATAPDHALAIVQLVVQFAKDVLHLGQVATVRVGARVDHVGAEVQHAAATVKDAAAGAVAAIEALLHPNAPPAPPLPAPVQGAKDDAGSAASGLLELAKSKASVLP
jgi:hypothetical protein